MCWDVTRTCCPDPQRLCRSDSEVPDIYVTGHSLGGALAALFTTAWCSDNPRLGPKVLILDIAGDLCSEPFLMAP